jgi:hypothetical protein
MRSEERGAHDLPLIILFGVILAFFLAYIFITVYDQQLSARVDDEASALVNELAKSAFASVSGGQPIFDLPRDLGGSTYELTVQDNSIFVVRILAGRRSGSSYQAVVNATLMVEDGNFSQSGRVFFMREGEKVIVSASPIEARPQEVIQHPSVTPPPFYHFAKEKQIDAAAIAAVYFDAKTRYPAENIDVLKYRRDDNFLLVQVKRGSGASVTMRVRVSENRENVGVVKNAWIVEVPEYTEESVESEPPCPSPDQAHLNGWLNSPQEVLTHLRSRTWYRADDNAVVTIPYDANVQAAAVVTNVSTYPAWRVLFGEYTIFYRMMPWWEEENTAGFLFQSKPEINPII